MMLVDTNVLLYPGGVVGQQPLEGVFSFDTDFYRIPGLVRHAPTG